MDPRVIPILECLCRYIYGEVSLEAVQELLRRSPFVEESIGKAEYLDLLALDTDVLPEGVCRTRARYLIDRRFPGQLLKRRAHHVCEAILQGTMDLTMGIRKMVSFRHEPHGEEVIPRDFAGLDCETASLSNFSIFPRRAPQARREQLTTFEELRPEVLKVVRAFLAQTA